MLWVSAHFSKTLSSLHVTLLWHCVLLVWTVKRVFISAQTQTVMVPVKGRWSVAWQFSGVDTTTRCGTGCMRLLEAHFFFSVALIRIQIHIPWKHLESFNNESSPYYFSELPAFTSSHAFSNQTCCHGQKNVLLFWQTGLWSFCSHNRNAPLMKTGLNQAFSEAIEGFFVSSLATWWNVVIGIRVLKIWRYRWKENHVLETLCLTGKTPMLNVYYITFRNMQLNIKCFSSLFVVVCVMMFCFLYYVCINVLTPF